MANQDLTPWRGGGLTPFGSDPFANFRREMDRLFEDFFAPPVERRSFAAGAEPVLLRPMIDVEETEQAYTVTAELPGLTEKNIELSLRDNALTISGEKRSERDEENGGQRYSERSYGRFMRTIPLQAEVDPEQVKATCRNGVLKVTLPKNPRAREQTRRIEIKAEPGSEPSTAKRSESPARRSSQ